MRGAVHLIAGPTVSSSLGLGSRAVNFRGPGTVCNELDSSSLRKTGN